MPASSSRRYQHAPRTDSSAKILETACNGTDEFNSEMNGVDRPSKHRSKTDLDLSQREKFLQDEKYDINGTLSKRDVIMFKSFYNRRTTLEKYLCIVSALLFVGCVTLVVIAFVGINKEKMKNPVFLPNPSSTLTEKKLEVCMTEECVKIAGTLMKSLDKTVDPCEDFFEFACGTFNKEHVIPDDKSTVNTFEMLHDSVQLKLKLLLEEKPSSTDTNVTLKAKNLYRSCINTSQIEAVGDNPLRVALKELGGWPVADRTWDSKKFQLEDFVAKLRIDYNTPVLVESWVGIDDQDSTRYILQMDQPMLGLPSRQYYLQHEDSPYIKAYFKYMVDIAMLLGANRTFAQQEMRDVLQFETKLANITIPAAERHDAQAMVQKMSITQLQRTVPKWSWLRYIQNCVPFLITEDDNVAVLATEYFKKLADLVTVTDSRVLTNYMLWRMVMGYVPELDSSYREKTITYRKVIEGVIKEPSRWIKCVEYSNQKMGMAVGIMFLNKHFDKHSKSTALEMIHNIREAFNELLDHNEWMDERTKIVAHEKAAAMSERIGYPEYILNETVLEKNYEQLTCKHDAYFENILGIERLELRKNMQKLNEPVKKDTWDQEPAIVNAFYNPNTNDIVFPAGILQPLFYSRHFPKSLNYGGVGVVIGHEMTHGFDGKGRQYDKNGNLQQWWDNQTIEAFKRQAKCMEEQYSNYTMKQIGMNIDGKNTLGENIADNGGIKQSFRAYRKWVSIHGEEPALPGINMTHNQLFFVNYAQIWCGSMRDEAALRKIRTEVHSPGQIRVLGPLSNSYDFADAYHCPVGSRMNPQQKCSVW